MSAVESATVAPSIERPKPRPWYHSPGFVILMLVLFFPVGIWLMLAGRVFPTAVRWVITIFFVLVGAAQIKNGMDMKPGRPGSAARTHSGVPKITDIDSINARIKFLRDRPPQVSDGDPMVMFWGHISSAIEARPSTIKAYDFGSDGSIEGVEMVWQVLGSEDKRVQELNTLIGQVVICQMIALIGGYEDRESSVLAVNTELTKLVMERGQEAVNNEVEHKFGTATIRYSIIQDGGKNSPLLRIGKCREF